MKKRLKTEMLRITWTLNNNNFKLPDFLQVMKTKNHKDIYLQSERDR